MIGRSVIKSLRQRGSIMQPIFHEDLDLMNYEQTRDLFIDMKPDYCIHLAGYNGNIKFNSLYPAEIFHRTSTMGLNVLKACIDSRILKTVSVLSSCGYKAGDQPLKEEEFLNGEPDESTEAHAYGKRDLLIYSKLLHKQYGETFVCALFNTTYGPHDNFDLNKTKVVGSLIKKFVDAVDEGDKLVECWGSGKPKRELIFCDDVAEGIVQTLEKYDNTQLPLNLGFDQDVTIKELSEKIAELVGFSGDIKWDLSRSDGQMRKILDSSRMKKEGIILNQTSLNDGLQKTIEWYRLNKGIIK